ncbi:MAG: SusC/RagA family TonB-linked outer membrane protein [Bacteroidales bacterium]|nr:SusC/RagA family TonB-linked outer membrane protein [Bacteroidales bacterium]
MKKQLFLLLFSLVAVIAQARTVTGTVVDGDGEPLIGASVQVKGVQGGVATDIDGKYSINVPNDKATLVFSNVGCKPQSIVVGSRSVIDVTLHDDAETLGEVVVTAMGQSQEKSKLNFSVSELKADEVTAGQSANFVNSLQGKVAGLQVSTAGGSPNSASQIVIRAISSINNAQSNEPLFVIDGMAVRGGASSIGDINANDIETMSVLKGAAASALYGQEGANGVIIITTKSGKEGKVNVTVNGGWEISNVLRKPKLQDIYVGGANGFYVSNSAGGWGPRMSTEDVYYDNVDNFLGTGFMQKYDISLSGGNEKYSAYASASYMDNEGVVPKDYKKRMSVFVKGEFNPSKAVKIMISSNFIDSKSRAFGNSMSTVYGWSINKDMSDYADPDTGLPNWSNRYDKWDELTNQQRVDATVSPYYGRYMDRSESESSRVILNGSIQWEPIKNLTFTGKVNYDKGWSSYESAIMPRFSTSGKEFIFDPVYDEKGNQTGTEFPKGIQEDYDRRMGEYVYTPSRSEQFRAQMLGNYYWNINDDFNLNFFLGAEYSQNKGVSAGLGGYKFVLDGDFVSMNNLSPEYLQYGSGEAQVYLNHSKRNKYGYFGEIRFDYRNVIQVSVTGRVDGSSTLLQSDKTTYFYPSFTGGIIFSELFHLQSPVFSYGKIRGNWAKVGKDAPANQFSDNYKTWTNFPDGGFGVNPTISKALYLEPEMTKSWEVGADLRFFRNRTRLDIAYYSTTVDNQIVTVRVSPSSGTILQTRNEGSIENKGMEISLAQDILQGRDFNWTANVNFSYNRGKVVSLPENVSEIQGGQYGDIFASAYAGGSTTSLSGIDYMRNENGDVLIDESGYPRINPAKGNLIGNREPKCLIGVGSTFSWKDLSLSFLFDGRVGGDVANITGRGLFSNGQAKGLVPYRNHKVVFKGVVENGDGTYSQNTTPVILDQTTFNNYIYGVSSNFIENGSYLRLSYVTLAYDFTRLMGKLGSSNPIKGLKCSLTGRNLFLCTKYTGADPQVMPSAANGTGAMGIDNYSVPSMRSFNFNVNVTF